VSEIFQPEDLTSSAFEIVDKQRERENFIVSKLFSNKFNELSKMNCMASKTKAIVASHIVWFLRYRYFCVPKMLS